MSNEIRVTARLKCKNGSLDVPETGGTYNADQTTLGGGGPGTVTIGTSEEDISFGDIAPGYVHLINCDTTNYVLYGPKNGSAALQNFAVLRPGAEAVFEFWGTGVTMRAVANAAPVKVQITAVTY